VKLRGLAKVDWLFVFSCAAFNLIRIPKLRAQSARTSNGPNLRLPGWQRGWIGSPNKQAYSERAPHRMSPLREGILNKLLDIQLTLRYT
jgi:hypothetical protein